MSNNDLNTGRNAAKKAPQAQPISKTISADFIPQPSPDFVITPSIQDLTDRAIAYLKVGYAVHLSGPAGTGKTTLALHIASQLARPCTLLHGDDELKGSDLVGKDSGYRRQSIRDNYVSSILKTEETVSVMWTNNRLTTACEQGHTLVYDEFTRSPATANNILLSVLEEGILNIPSSSQDKGYIKVHSDFRAIFTSNPEEYVGVHKTQDALLDRMITLEVSHQDRETELAIVTTKSNRSAEDAAIIVDIIRALRDRLGGNGGPTIRAALAIASIADFRCCSVNANDKIFLATCQDVLHYNAVRQSPAAIKRQDIESIVRKFATRSEVKPVSTISPSATKTVEKKQENEVAHRVEATLDAVTQGIATETLSKQISANSAALETSLNSTTDIATASTATALLARSNKNVASPLAQESLTDQVRDSDEQTVNEASRSLLTRKLPMPPSIDGSKARVSLAN